MATRKQRAPSPPSKSRKALLLGQQVFADESKYPATIQNIGEMLHDTYAFVREHFAGMSGQTYQIRSRLDGATYCLKTVKAGFPDPGRVRETLRKEVEILRPLTHRCLPKTYEADFSCQPPFYVCTFHPGKTFASFRDTGQRLTLSETTTIVTSLIDTLEYLHSQRRTHCDLHEENILIGPRIFADGLLIIDLGSGHRLSAARPNTKDRGHLAHKLIDDMPGFRHQVERLAMQDSWEATDFKALGRLLVLMLDPFFGSASAAQRKALMEFGRDLLTENISDWQLVKERFDFVLDPDLLSTRAERYLSRDDGSQSSIVLPATERVRVGDAALAVINSREFQRLRGIKQLSFCEWYFPGAVHTRFEHSLGVFGATQQAIQRLSRKSEVKSRFSQRNVDGALLASLLHDVGHYPLAHVIEHYVAARYPTDPELRRSIHHGENTRSYLSVSGPLRSLIAKNWGEDTLEEALRNLDGHCRLFSQILDGPIDCDKLDYLRRDAHHCGVPYGKSLNADAILSAYSCDPSTGNLVIPEDAVPAVEGMVVAQDQMLTTVYWARTTRALFAMCHRYLDIIVSGRKDRLVELTAKLKEAQNETDAFRALIGAISWADPKYSDAARSLISLHESFDFSMIYKPIQKYSIVDQLKPNRKATANVYQKIIPKSRFTLTSKHHPNPAIEEAPIEWSLVKRLRLSYMQVLKTKGAQNVTSNDVLIDVPWGKPFNNMINVLRSDGTVVPVTDVSHIASTYFTLPIAFNAPIRVYLRPDLHSRFEKSLASIAESAEALFDDNRELEDE